MEYHSRTPRFCSKFLIRERSLIPGSCTKSSLPRLPYGWTGASESPKALIRRSSMWRVSLLDNFALLSRGCVFDLHAQSIRPIPPRRSSPSLKGARRIAKTPASTIATMKQSLSNECSIHRKTSGGQTLRSAPSNAAVLPSEQNRASDENRRESADNDADQLEQVKIRATLGLRKEAGRGP